MFSIIYVSKAHITAVMKRRGNKHLKIAQRVISTLFDVKTEYHTPDI